MNYVGGDIHEKYRVLRALGGGVSSRAGCPTPEKLSGQLCHIHSLTVVWQRPEKARARPGESAVIIGRREIIGHDSRFFGADGLKAQEVAEVDSSGQGWGQETWIEGPA
jgi:hypothetical protein